MHSIVTTFREAVIKVEVANFGAANRHLDRSRWLLWRNDRGINMTLPCKVKVKDQTARRRWCMGYNMPNIYYVPGC